LKNFGLPPQKKVENTPLIVHIMISVISRDFRITVPQTTTGYSSLIKYFIAIVVIPRKTNI